MKFPSIGGGKAVALATTAIDYSRDKFGSGRGFAAASRDKRFNNPFRPGKTARVYALWVKIKSGKITGLSRRLIESDHAEEFAEFDRQAAQLAAKEGAQ